MCLPFDWWTFWIAHAHTLLPSPPPLIFPYLLHHLFSLFIINFIQEIYSNFSIFACQGTKFVVHHCCVNLFNVCVLCMSCACLEDDHFFFFFFSRVLLIDTKLTLTTLFVWIVTSVKDGARAFVYCVDLSSGLFTSSVSPKKRMAIFTKPEKDHFRSSRFKNKICEWIFSIFSINWLAVCVCVCVSDWHFGVKKKKKRKGRRSELI